jgi:hypothetical protein
MDFYTNQDRFLQIADSILQTHQPRLEKIKALCNFVAIEEGLVPDDIAVAGRILRQLIWLGQQCINEFELTCKDLEPENSVKFGICECKLEDSINGLIGIYAYTPTESQEILTFPNMASLPKNINSHERMVLILDVFNRASYIPWQHK